MTKAKKTRASRAWKLPTAVSKLPEGDVEILLHELQGRHVELEMQNEELRRRQLELEKLLQSQERLQALFDHTPDGIVFADRQTRKLIQGNAAFAQMLGYPAADIAGLQVADLHPADSLPHVLAQFERMSRREIPVAEDIPVQRQDGSVFLAEVRSFPVTIAGTVQLAASFRDITERRLAGAQLAEAVRELQDVKVAFDQHSIVAITDAQGKITYANDKFCAISKYSRAELLGQDHRILNSGYHPKEFIHRLWTTIGQGQIWKGEIKNRAKDGACYWVDTTIVPSLNADGKPYQYVAIRTDITERRQAQAVLRESEERFRTLFQSATIGIALRDASGRFLNTNRTYQEMLGYSGAELKRLGSKRITYPEDMAEEERLVAGLRAGTRDAYQLEHRYWGRKRRLIWVKASASAVRDHLGELRFIITMVEDITGRKQAEDQIRLLVNSVHSTQELICITDQKNRFQFVNRAFLSAYGYTEPELLGRKPELLSAPANPPELCDQIYQQTLGGGWQGEIVNRRKDGTEFPIALNTSQIKDGAGRILGLVGVARDISAQKRAEKQSAAFALLGHRLSGATTPAQAAAIILEIASALFGWDAGYVDLYSPEEDKILPVLTIDTLEGRRTAIPASTLKLEPSPLMRSIMKDGWRLVNRTRQARTTVALVPFGDTQRRSASMMYVPINASDTVLGILSIQSYQPHAYSERDLQLLQTLADHCGEALRRIEVTEARSTAELKYQRIFEQATEGIVQTTPDGRYLGANPAAARMLGYATPAELITSVTDIEGQTYVRPEEREALERLLATQDFVQGFEVERYRRDGSRLWMSINRHVVRDATGAILYYEGTNQDITERKRAQEELRRLPQRIIAAQESERLHVARELHDGVNQLLASAKMRLGKVEAGLRATAPAAGEILRRCGQLLVQALEENRRIAHDLRPSDLDELGLAAAGRNFCAEFQARAALRVQPHFPREWQRLPPAVELNLFRILQEALTNVEKYSQAKTVRVRLSVEDAVVSLKIHDDGCGFAPNAEPKGQKGRRGIGLTNMRERAVAMGGTCELISVPKQGTIITVRVPLSKAK